MNASAKKEQAWCRRLGPVYAYRNIAKNRLLVGVPRDHVNGWEDYLESLGFSNLPIDRGPLLFWISRKHPPDTAAGRLHTNELIEALMNKALGHVPADWRQGGDP